jgi:hypothetical protein
VKIDNISLYTNGREVANFSFRDPSSRKPYVITNSTGLDADEIVAKFYGACGVTGKKFHNLSLKKRQIVIRISLNPDFSTGKTYSDLRDDMYKAVSASRTGLVELRFNQGLASVAVTSGFVTKFESPYFTADPEVQITIDPIITNLQGFDMVELDPYSLEMANTIVDPFSTAPHGLYFELTMDAIADRFIVRDSGECSWQFTVEPGLIGADEGFLVGDKLVVSSNVDDKYVYIVRDDVKLQIMSKVIPGSIWPVIFPGPTDFEFLTTGATTPEGETEDYTWNAMSYYPSYWGV